MVRARGVASDRVCVVIARSTVHGTTCPCQRFCAAQSTKYLNFCASLYGMPTKTRRRRIAPANNPLSKALDERIESRGMSLRDAAAKMSTSHSTLSGWIGMGSRPEPESWQPIAEFLGWTVNEVQESLGLGNGERSATASLSPEEEELLGYMRSLDEIDRELVVGIARQSAEIRSRQSRQAASQEEGERAPAARRIAGAGRQ